MTLDFRPRSYLRLHLLSLLFLPAAVTPAAGTDAAAAQNSPSLMEICEGSHDPIELEEPASAEGELRFTIIATGKENSTPVDAAEQCFRRWGVGWHGDPGIRYRSQGGWFFTIQGRIEPKGSEGSRDSSSMYYSDEDHDYSSADETRRNILFAVSRQFRLWRRLSLGPVMQLTHSYWRQDREGKQLDIDEEDQTYELDEYTSSERRESYGINLGLMPVWSFGERLSLETSFCLRYYRNFYKYESWNGHLDDDSSYYEGTSSNSSTNDGFSIDSKSFSADMALGLYFYF